mgnify:CR=1 FL=1
MGKEFKILSPTATKTLTVEQFNNDDMWQDVSVYGESRNKTGEIQKGKKYKQEIATIYRCIDIRAGAVASVPFTVYDLKNGDELVNSSNFWSNDKFRWLSILQNLLYLTEASLLLTSEAFWLKERSLTKKNLGFRWLAAPYINPIYSSTEGITGFERQLNTGQKETFTIDDVVYFMTPNPLGELVPDTPQVLSAAASAGVILNYENFISEFYKRGAVKATVLSVDRSVPPRERERLRNFWQDMMSGIKNAFTTEVVSGDVTAQVIGEGAGDSEKTEVLRDRRKDIATGMGVPFSLLFGDSSASYTAGPTEELNFLKYTIARRINLVQEVLNQSIFTPEGTRIRFYIEHLPAFRDFGATQVDIFKKYTDSLLPASLAARLSGIQLPDGVTYEDLDDFVDKERERQFQEKERIVTLNSKINEQKGGDGKQPSKKRPEEDNNLKSIDSDEFDREIKIYRKWLRNRKFVANPFDFDSTLLSDELKMEIYNEYWKDKEVESFEVEEY